MPKLPRRGDDDKKKRNSSDDPEEFRATLVEHLEELRTRIMRSIGIIAVCWVIGWFLEPWFYTTLQTMVETNIRKVLPPGVQFINAFGNITEPFMLQLRLSFAIGLIPAAPLVILQIWGFVAPGLKERERRPFRVLAPFSVLLFLMGAGFCWIILPAALQWFGSYLGNYRNTSLFQSPNEMIFFIAKMMLAFGIGFELPLVVYALGALGLLSSETLIKYWRQATVFIFIASATLTPSNDAFSMLMMAIPLCILFIISVYAVKFTQRKRKNEEQDVYVSSVDEDFD